MDKTGIIVNIPPSTQPVLLRSRFVHSLVQQVNRNTLTVSQPRQVEPTDNSATPAAKVALATGDAGTIVENPATGEDSADEWVFDEAWSEIRRRTSTVRVENPDDAEQWVDVERIDEILFVKSDGSTARLSLNNS